MVNCKKCMMSRNCSTRSGLLEVIDLRCYGQLDGNYIQLKDSYINDNDICPMLKISKEITSNIRYAKWLLENKEWTSFEGKIDKRTAYYKSIKKIIQEGGKQFLKIYDWSEFQYDVIDHNPSYEFYWLKAIVYYGNGIFKIHKFRELINGRSGNDL